MPLPRIKPSIQRPRLHARTCYVSNAMAMLNPILLLACLLDKINRAFLKSSASQTFHLGGPVYLYGEIPPSDQTDPLTIFPCVFGISRLVDTCLQQVLDTVARVRYGWVLSSFLSIGISLISISKATLSLILTSLPGICGH